MRDDVSSTRLLFEISTDAESGNWKQQQLSVINGQVKTIIVRGLVHMHSIFDLVVLLHEGGGV